MSDLALLTGLGIGIILVCLVVSVAAYVLSAFAHFKALNALGYDKAWMGWIPYARFYAYADAVAGDEENVKLFDTLEIPAVVFKLWWVVELVLAVLSLVVSINSTLVNVINIVLEVVFLGCTYAKMYARLENKTEKDEQVLGCVSGFLPIIAIVKFLSLK